MELDIINVLKFSSPILSLTPGFSDCGVLIEFGNHCEICYYPNFTLELITYFGFLQKFCSLMDGINCYNENQIIDRVLFCGESEIALCSLDSVVLFSQKFDARIVAIDTYSAYIALFLSNGDVVILKVDTEFIAHINILDSIPSCGFKATLKFGDENTLLIGIAEENSKELFLLSKKEEFDYDVNSVPNVCSPDTDRPLDDYWVFEYCSKYCLFVASHPSSSELGLIQLHYYGGFEVLDGSEGENICVPVNEEDYISEHVTGMKLLPYENKQYLIFAVESGNDAIVRIDRIQDEDIDITVDQNYQVITKPLSPLLSPQKLLSLSIKLQNEFQSHLDHAHELVKAITNVHPVTDSQRY